MARPSRCDLRVAAVSTYPPRECGIGTFTRDLLHGLHTLPQPVAVSVGAINGAGEQYDYDATVQLQMEEGNPRSYLAAAHALNQMRTVDVVSIQHDFGKFGVWGDRFEEDYLVPMLRLLQKPTVVTMHSVTPHPNELMRQTVQGMGEHAQTIVVMANIAKVLLQEDYGLDDAALAKVQQIPHGVPRCPRTHASASLEAAKRAVGMQGRRVVSTFGLINEGKGIEYAIAAMPALVEQFPDLVYLVIGQTHPEVRKVRGEKYRNDLRALAQRLGIEEHVRFVNRFLPQGELIRYLAATDVYVTPYLSRNQITSGTLAYALGCGKAIVSTPYLYAAEALADGRGVLAEFRSAESLANAIQHILANPDVRHQVEHQAMRYGQEMGWPAVAASYRNLFCELRDEGSAARSPAGVAAQATPGISG
ncbi:MAG TPA: glycosyltransferase family 4 protein [Chloroflexota bacterium]|jgi:glycosyltransferase involved in cell wall biosynthesis